jgi:hypothetical protein
MEFRRFDILVTEPCLICHVSGKHILDPVDLSCWKAQARQVSDQVVVFTSTYHPYQ